MENCNLIVKLKVSVEVGSRKSCDGGCWMCIAQESLINTLGKSRKLENGHMTDCSEKSNFQEVCGDFQVDIMRSLD